MSTKRRTQSPRRAKEGGGARAIASPVVPPAVRDSALRVAARSLPRVLAQMRRRTSGAPVSTARLGVGASAPDERWRQTRGTTRPPAATIRAGIRSLLGAVGYSPTALQGAVPSLTARAPRPARRSCGETRKAQAQVNAGGGQ